MTIRITIRSLNLLVRIALIACGCALISACGGAFGTSNSTAPGTTPNIAGQVSFRVVGTLGTPFSLLISDADSSWQVQGVVPLSIVIINTKTPVRMVATKLVNDSSLLSIEIISGFSVAQVSSTTAGFGAAVGSFGGKLSSFAAPASPDVRFFVKAPSSAIFNALIEDLSAGEIVQMRAPALLLFDKPNGGNLGKRIDGIFDLVNFFGPFDIDLIVGGALVRVAAGGSHATLKFP
jgi:hypothetical protein